jgi:sucrose-6-phosphate hydrolase SacC (GH32 family)
LGVTQAAIESAQLTLQPYYYNFYNMCETVLQSQANLMKKAWGGKSKIGWILGDNAKEFFSIDPKSDWHLDDYGIFVETGIKSEQNKQLILKMAEQLLPTVQEPEMALSIIKMFNAASGAEAEKILEKGIEAVQKLKDEARKFEAMQTEKALQVQAQSAQAKAEAEKEKSNTLKEVAIINAQSAEQIAAMKLDHKSDEQIVKFKNAVLENVATHLLDKDKQEQEAELSKETTTEE